MDETLEPVAVIACIKNPQNGGSYIVEGEASNANAALSQALRNYHLTRKQNGRPTLTQMLKKAGVAGLTISVRNR